MQKKILNKNFIYLIIFFIVISCTSVPKYPQNACKIFGQNYLWYKSVKKSSETYGAPIHIILAFVNKESGFLYYLDKNGHVSRTKMARGATKGGSSEVVANAGVQRESGWLYFIDKDGDVARTKMARGRK